MPSMMLLKFLPGYSPKDKTFDSLTHYSVINIKEGLAKTVLFFFFFPVNNDFYLYFKEMSYRTMLQTHQISVPAKMCDVV